MPTITVRRFTYEALASRLSPEARIVVLSCDSCARQCDGLGGEQGLAGLADKLAADGFNVVRRELLPVACSPAHLADRLSDEAVRRLFQQADVVIPLSCCAGEQRAAELLGDGKVLSVTKTLGKGYWTAQTGARLTDAAEGVDVDIDAAEGITLADAAERLGLHSGRF